MTPEQKASYIQAQTVCALAEIEGMKAANEERKVNGLSLAYDEKSFIDIPIYYGITHNQVVAFFGEY